MRGPGIEPGSTAWKATMLTITPATLHLLAVGRQTSAMAKGCILRGSNSRGLCPLGLKSSALTTRPRMHTVGKRGHTAYQPVPTHHNHPAPPAPSPSTPGNYGGGGAHKAPNPHHSTAGNTKSQQQPTKKIAPRVRLELTTYRLTAGRATDCAIQDYAFATRANT